MSFPFPRNPIDGQVVVATAPDGATLTATYRAAQNDWEVSRQGPPGTAIHSGSPPTAVIVRATADGQVITWDQASRQWVARNPQAASGGTSKSFIKATQTAPDEPNGVGPARLLAGDLQVTAENLHKELKVWDGSAWVEAFSEDTIKQWISAGSLFRGVVKEATLTALPVVSAANRGFYYSWTGLPGHVVQAADAGIGGDLAGEVLQVGDWIQSDGTKWVHVPGDLLSKQRWDSLGSFAPWSDTSWEKGSVVSHKGGFWRASALISPGDDEPEVAPGNKWVDITPHPSLRFGDLADVDDAVALLGDDGVVVWDETAQAFGVSRDLSLDGIAFAASGSGAVLEGFCTGDLVANANLEGQAPSVKTVADALAALELEGLSGCEALAVAANGEVVAWSSADNKWVPKTLIETLAGLKDVDLTTPVADGQILVWDQTDASWRPAEVARKLADLEDVNDNAALTGQDGVVIWDEAAGEFVVSRTMQIDGIEFDASGPGVVLAGLFQGDISLSRDLDDQVPSVKAVADYIGYLQLNKLADVTLVGTPATGQLLRYNADHWENLDPDFYTRSETDQKLTALASGLEHEEAALSIANDPPAAPAAYDLHIVGTAPTGAWVGHANELAEWDGKAWKFTAARAHEAHLVEADGITWSWNGTAWVKVAAAAPPIALGLTAPNAPANGQAWLDQGGGGLKVYDGSRWAAASSSYWEASVTMGANAGTVGNQIILAKGIVPTNDGIYISIVDTQIGHSGGRSAYAIHAFSTDSMGSAKATPIHVEPTGTRFSKLHWFWKDNSDGYVLAATISEACVGAVYRVGLLSPTARLDAIHGDGDTLTTDTTSGATIDVSTSTGVGGLSNDAFDSAVKAAVARVFPTVATPNLVGTAGTPSTTFSWINYKPGTIHRWIVDVDRSAKWVPVLYMESSAAGNKTAKHDGLLFVGADQFALDRSDAQSGPTHSFKLGFGDDNNSVNSGNIAVVSLEFYEITARHHIVVKYRMQYRRKTDDKQSICEALMYLGGQDTQPMTGRYALNAFAGDTPYELRQY